MVYTLHVQLLIVRVVELLVCLHDHKFKEKHILCILSRIFDFLDSTGDASSCYYVLCHIMTINFVHGKNTLRTDTATSTDLIICQTDGNPKLRIVMLF